jgi:hypothetical protein
VLRRDMVPMYMTMPALAVENVRSWSSGVRTHLEVHAPRFLVIFDEGPELPDLLATPVEPVAELADFLNHKLAVLDRIIRAIVEDSNA